MMKKNFLTLILALVISGCLKTRSELGGNYQSQMYSSKQAENQQEAQAQKVKAEQAIESEKADDRDEMIRTLNGRIEVLENQLTSLQKDKEAEKQKEGQPTAESQKVQLLQESLAKMEAQLQKLESELAAKPSDAREKTSTTNQGAASPAAMTKNAKQNPYEKGIEHFGKKEWKKAILEFQKYVDEAPKGKLVADAKLHIGLSFQELGLKDEARAFYEEVAAQYPKTEAGKKAKSKLSKK